ncbi:glutamate decarboxylase 1 isoform X2 [Prionailurus iriomotensis]
MDKEQLRKKSGHAFQSTEKNVTEGAHTEEVMMNLSNAYASDLLPSKDGKDLTKCFLLQAVWMGHPRFFNQLSSRLDVVRLAGAWLTATANTNTLTYEIAPVFTIMETILLKKMYGIIGWGETEADGIFAPAGKMIPAELEKNILQAKKKWANSATWNPQKLMGVPLQCSAILIREKGLLEACNEMHTAYLFQPDKLYNVDFDTGDKTIQCGQHVDVFKLWLMWKAKGTCGFEAQINRHMELAKYFCKVLKQKDNFKHVFDAEPEFTNVCFWYFPPRLKHIPEGFERDQELQKILGS